MGKKKQTLTVTVPQKVLGTAALVSALLYLFYHSAMSVLQKIIVYGGVWPLLSEVTFWLAVGAGALYLGYQLLLHPMKQEVRQALFKRAVTPDHLILLALMILMFVSVASIQGTVPSFDWWSMNRDFLFDMAGQVLILFPLGCWVARHRNGRAFRLPAHAFTVIFMVLEIWILIRTFTNRPIMLANGGGIGIDENLSLIINCNRNTTGLWGYCYFFLCLWLAVTSPKGLKPLYLLGMLVNLTVIALSMSRASLYSNCLLMGLFVAIGFLYQKKFRLRNGKTQIPGSILLGVAAAVTFYFFNSLLYSVYLKVSNIQELLGIDASAREFFDATLSGRMEIWLASLKALTYDARSFFFGVSPVGIYYRMDELVQLQMYTHNQILEFGVGCGVPAMILFIVYGVRMFLQSVRICFRSGNRDLRYTMASLCCFLMLMGNMFEATLYGYHYLSGMIYMVACGYLAELSRDPSLIRAGAEEGKP